MTKRQRIIAAYSENVYSRCSDYIDENGWCSRFYRPPEAYGFREFSLIDKDADNSVAGKWRPRSLDGLENNNGWIKVVSIDDLPKDKGDYKVFNKTGRQGTFTFHVKPSDYVKRIMFGTVTHWKPIVDDQNPLY